MSSRSRLTLCAATATILVMLALSPLATPRGWVVQGAVLVMLISAAGALGRRLAVPRPLTALGQLLVGLLFLTVQFASEPAVLGLLPGPAALSELGKLLSNGVSAAGQYSTPAPAVDGIRLLLLTGIGGVAVLVDLIAVGYERAALGGLPLLALYSVAASLTIDQATWLWFLLASAGYLLLLFAEGRNRLSRWGRVFPGRGRSPQAAGSTTRGAGPNPQIRTGRRIGVAALGVALLLPMLLPKIGDGLIQTGTGGGGNGSGPGRITAVNPMVSLKNSLNQPINSEVLRYRTNAPDKGSMYLRITALDDFNGTEWKPAARRPVQRISADLQAPAGLGEDIARKKVQTSITASGDYRQGWLPMPYPMTRVEAPGRWRFEPVARVVIGEEGQTTGGIQYKVGSLQLNPSREQLLGAPAQPPEQLRKFTRLPKTVPTVVRREAERVTKGAKNHYEQAVALQRWFADSGEFAYDIEVKSGAGSNAMARFLRAKEGYCEHFASTMAVMARHLGIPARVAIGFIPGAAQNDDSYKVGVRDAHAWPELYFEGAGWVRFEPTPSRGTTPSYTRDAVSNPAGGSEPLPQDSLGATPRASSSSTACTGGRANCGPEQNQGAGGADSDDAVPSAPVLAAGAVLVVLLMLLAVPMLVRTRIRRGRTRWSSGGAGSGGAGDDGAAEAVQRQVRALWQELLDSAWDLGLWPDEALTPRRAMLRLAADAKLDAEATGVAQRIAGATEQALYAPAGRRAAVDAEAMAGDVRTVRRAMAAGSGRRVRMRAVLMPRSTVRIAWRLLDRFAEVRARWKPAGRPSWVPGGKKS